MEEIWKPIGILGGIDYESRYSVSNYGRMRRNMKPRYGARKNYKHKILKGSCDLQGYSFIALWNKNKFKNYRINRLVAWKFLGLDIENRELLACHKDETLYNGRLRNDIRNLFIGTHKDNQQDAVKKGRHGGQGRFGKLNHASVPVEQITLDGEVINIWDSQKDAERVTGIKAGNISTACKKKNRTAGGYKWRLVED